MQEARARLDTLTAERRRSAPPQLESLRAQAEQANARALEAQQARAVAEREELIRDGFAERVAAASAASEELWQLQPLAARHEELSTREQRDAAPS